VVLRPIRSELPAKARYPFGGLSVSTAGGYLCDSLGDNLVAFLAGFEAALLAG
jgi:hypothetical protein